MNKNILFVETDAFVIEAATSALTACGFRVDVSSDLKSPIETVRQKMPDLLIMGIELSASQNGYILCSRIKKDEQLKAIPLILIGNPAGFEGHKKLKTRADDYVAKPLDTSELISRVRRVLNEPELNAPQAHNLDELIEVTLSDAVVITPLEGETPSLDSTQLMRSASLPEEIPSTETEEPAEGWFEHADSAPNFSEHVESMKEEKDQLNERLRESQEKSAQHEARIRELEAELLRLSSQQQGFGFIEGHSAPASLEAAPVDLQATLDLRQALANLGDQEVDFSWVLAENHELKRRINELEEYVLQAEDRITRMYFRMKNEESLRVKAKQTSQTEIMSSLEDASL